MTLRDFLKRVTEEDKDKMMIFRDGIGWDNVGVKVEEHEITIYCNGGSPFTSDN